MQVRLPEEDQEESLHQPARTADSLGERTQRERSQPKHLKYLIVASLAVLIIIVMFYSSLKQVKVIHVSPIINKNVQVPKVEIHNPANSFNIPLNQQQENKGKRISASNQKTEKVTYVPKDPEQQKENERLNQIVLGRKAAIEKRKHENPQERLRKNAEKNKLNPPQKPNYKNNQFVFSPETMIKQQPKEETHISTAKEKEHIQGYKDIPKNEEKAQNLLDTQKQENAVSTQKSSTNEVSQSRGTFIVPQFVWTYAESEDKITFFVEKCFENIKSFADKSSFKTTVLNSQNYKAFLQPATAQKVDGLIALLEERMTKEPNSNLKDSFSTIKKRLIAFHVLNEKGGVFVERNVLLTESLDWLWQIEDNIYVNKGSAGTKAKYVGFFDPDHGSLPAKHNKKGVHYDTEKYMVEYTCLEPYFIAALANEAFLTETLVEYVEILTAGTGLQEKLKQLGVNMGALHGKDLYYETFYASQHIVLRRKQQQLDSSGANANDDTFAIDHYGLMAINERYFPKKMDFFFGNRAPDKIYFNLARYSLEQLQATTGPLRYIACTPLQKYVEDRIQKARKSQKRYFIHPLSFLGKFVISNSSQPYLLEEYEKGTVDSQGKIWEKLPKTIWLYWDKGLENSSVANKLCVNNIRRVALNSQLQVKQLNDSNIELYLGKQLYEKIDKGIQNAKIQTFPQTRSDFVRLAIIAKYGGIYMDASYFSIKGLEWIFNISQAPSETIFNRYGKLPRVLMFFHPHYANAFDWTYDKQANTKKLVLNAYESSFIAAQPDQQFIWDWLEEHLRFITTSSKESEQRMDEFGVLQDNWGNVYLAVMDSVKIVIGKKNLEINTMIKQDAKYNGPKSAAQFYGLWSISGYREQQKFRAHTNYDNTFNHKPSDQNIYLWRYSISYVQGLIGNITHLTKLYGNGIKQMNKFLISDYDSNFANIHPHSFMAQYLYKPQIHKITKHEDQIALELIQS